jgi:hypothetical protein
VSDDPVTPEATPEPLPVGPADEGPHLSEYADPSVEVPPVPSEVRRYPSTIGGAVYLVVLAASIVGVVIVTRGQWRFGIVWIACALLGAALGRLVLPREQAGMLEVRRRSLDVVILAGFGVALLVLTASIKPR